MGVEGCEAMDGELVGASRASGEVVRRRLGSRRAMAAVLIRQAIESGAPAYNAWSSTAFDVAKTGPFGLALRLGRWSDVCRSIRKPRRSCWPDIGPSFLSPWCRVAWRSEFLGPAIDSQPLGGS